MLSDSTLFPCMEAGPHWELVDPYQVKWSRGFKGCSWQIDLIQDVNDVNIAICTWRNDVNQVNNETTLHPSIEL